MNNRLMSMSAAALLAALPAFASTINGEYSFTIIQQTRALGQNASFGNSVILSDGSVVTTVAFNGNFGQDRIEVVSPDGNKRVVNLGGLTVNTQTPLSANDKGQIITRAFDERNRTSLLLLIEPDTTVRTLISSPNIQPTGVADSSLSSISDLEINESGEIVASGSARLADGTDVTRVIKISDTSTASPQFQVLDETDTAAGRFVSTDVAIDDSGTAMWNRRNGDANEVVLSDGGPEQVVLFSDSPFSSQRVQYEASALTNTGLIAVTSTPGQGGGEEVGTSDVTDLVANEDFDAAFPLPRASLADVDVNEFGQVIANGQLVTGGDSTIRQAIALDGEVLIQGESAIDGITFSVNGNGDISANDGQFINDAGQFVFDAVGFNTEGGQRLTVRADPIGATPDHAILPDTVVDGVSNVSFELVNALGVDANSPIYIDPIFGEGLSYSITNGGPNFMSIVVPTQDLGGLSMFDVVFGGFTQTIGFGETIDFSSFVTGGVSKFDIFGTGGATSFTGDFVAGFTFAGQGSVVLDIAPTSQSVAPVPLPAGLPLLLAGLSGIFLLRCRKFLMHTRPRFIADVRNGLATQCF